MPTEFGFLKDLKNHFNLSQIGDDCAIFPFDSNNDYLISSDMLIEDIDFRLDWASPKHIGYKTLAVSISDVAAMAGNPVFSMISIGLPTQIWKSGFLDEFYEGYLDLAKMMKVSLIGGDISKTPEHIVIDSTVIGTIPKDKAVLRSGANTGDGIYVTGSLGGAAGGLTLLEKGNSAAKQFTPGHQTLINRQLLPQIKDGSKLLGVATSMIDISDGLSSDLKHLCDAGGVGAIIYADKIPIQTELQEFFETRQDQLTLALNGGEDFELLFTANAINSDEFEGLPAQRIGEITSNPGILELCHGDKTEILDPGGYSHF